MVQVTELMASWPVQWILIITLAALGFLALLGWLVCDLGSLGKLFRSIRQARQEIAQLWKKDPVENLKLFRDLVNSGKVGVLMHPINRAILYDQTGQPSAIADPSQSFEPRVIIAQAPGRFWAAPIFYLMIVIGICGTFLATLVQLEVDPSAAATTAVLHAMLVILLITLYKTVDLLVIHHATVVIEQFQDMLTRHFPVFGEIQLQYQILQGQRQTMIQMRSMGPELSANIGDSLQKQLVPAIRMMGQNMSQSFDQATKNLNELQQQGMGKLAAHFANQLEHLLGQNFENLATSIQTMNTLHESSSKRLQELLNSLDRSANLQNQSQEAAQLVLKSLSDSRLAITDSSAKLDQIYASSAENLNQTFSISSERLTQTLSAGTDQLTQTVNTSSEQLARTFNTSTEQLTQTFNTSTEQLTQTFNTSTEQLSQTFNIGTEKLSQTFTTGGDQLLEIFTTGGAVLNQSLTSGSDQLNQSYSKGSEQISSAMQLGAGQIEKAFNLNQDKLNDALTASADYFKQALVSNAENLTTSLSTSTGMLNDSTDRLNESTGLLNQALTTIAEKLNQVLETSTVEMKLAFASAADELNLKYTSGSDTLSRTFETGTEQLNLALSSGADQLAQVYSSSKVDLNQAIVSGTELLTQSLVTSSEQLSQNLVANSERYNQSLLSGTEQLGDALIRTSELASNLQDLLSASQESTNRFRQDQLQVEEQIGGYFDQMHQQIIQVQDDLQSNLVDIFSKFTDLTTTSLTQSDEQYQAMVTRLSEDSTQLMNMLDDQVRDLSFLVRDIASEISGLNKSMDGSLQLFGEQMKSSTQMTFESFDKGLADVVGQLTDTIRLISDAVDDLPAAVVSARDLMTTKYLSDNNSAT